MSASHIGKYRLGDLIGRGAMGEVFRAHDPDLDRYVALKVIDARDADKRLRFRREAQSAARLVHPNIVVVHDFGEESGRFFMAMELLDGSDLKSLIHANKFADLRERMQVMEQICDAVAFAHARNIVHRDLKPANIFVLPNARVKILDFGLARIGESEMTGTGMVLGTPNYMAPEQIRGHRVDGRADIFSLGSVFYELLSGRRAFEADSLHAVLYAVLNREPEPLRAIAPSVPPIVSELVMRALNKDPARRFRAVDEMRAAIHTLRGLATISPALTLTAMMRDWRSDTIVSHRDELMSGSTLVKPDAAARTPEATFVGEAGGDITIDVGTRTILEASLAAGIPHTHECGGHARCSTCRVIILGGGENLSPRDSAELKLVQRFGFAGDVRLACQTRVRGPVRLRRLIIDDSDVQLMRGTDKPALGNETPLAVLSVRAREISMLLRRAMPYDVVHINRYYLQIGETVLANGGSLEPPNGATQIAFFGLTGDADAKTKCTNAIRAALRLRARMETLNAYLLEHFATTLTVDIGMHYGRMIVGSVGHPDHMRLTALGEPSNIATAIAAMNENAEGNGILASEELINIVDVAVRHGNASHERIGDREHTIYEILDFAKPDTHYLVQSSFEKVAAKREEAARIFYKHLFTIAPQTRAMFAGVDMAVQGAMLMNMIAAAVKGLDRLDELKPVLVDLARRHAGYDVRIEHYAAVEACLLHTLATVIGPSFDLDVKLAWTAIYNFIAQTMMEAQFGA